MCRTTSEIIGAAPPVGPIAPARVEGNRNVYPDLMDSALVITTALFASFFSGITGGGVTVILLPVLVMVFGIQLAMPVITIALFAASGSRVVFFWRVVDFPVVGWFSLGALPMTVVGTYIFTVTEPDLLTRLLGAFLILAAVSRRLLPESRKGFSARWFFPLGFVFGFVTGITAVVAVMLAPFFLAYGLRKGAFVGTMGINVLLIQVAKLAVFGGTAFLGVQSLILGCILVPFMIFGTYLGKHLLAYVSERSFILAIEVVMVLAGANFLLRGAA